MSIQNQAIQAIVNLAEKECQIEELIQFDEKAAYTASRLIEAWQTGKERAEILRLAGNYLAALSAAELTR